MIDDTTKLSKPSSYHWIEVTSDLTIVAATILPRTVKTSPIMDGSSSFHFRKNDTRGISSTSFKWLSSIIFILQVLMLGTSLYGGSVILGASLLTINYAATVINGIGFITSILGLTLLCRNQSGSVIAYYYLTCLLLIAYIYYGILTLLLVNDTLNFLQSNYSNLVSAVVNGGTYSFNVSLNYTRVALYAFGIASIVVGVLLGFIIYTITSVAMTPLASVLYFKSLLDFLFLFIACFVMIVSSFITNIQLGLTSSSVFLSSNLGKVVLTMLIVALISIIHSWVCLSATLFPKRKILFPITYPITIIFGLVCIAAGIGVFAGVSAVISNISNLWTVIQGFLPSNMPEAYDMTQFVVSVNTYYKQVGLAFLLLGFAYFFELALSISARKLL
jgi:hypothetical protein